MIQNLYFYIYIYYTTQLYSNLVYNEHDTTYLCLVLDVLVSPKISRFRLASLCTLLLSPVASPLSIIIMHSLANDSLILIQENKGGPTPGHQNKELALLGGSRHFRITIEGKDVSG